MRCHALGERGELHCLHECEQLGGIGFAHPKHVGLLPQCRMIVEQHEFEGHSRIVGIGQQGLAALGLFDLAGALEQRLKIAISVDELGRGFHANTRHARYVVGGIARQRLHFHHLRGRHAETLDDLRRADLLVLHGVEQLHLAVFHQLHQVLVGGDDGDARAGLTPQTCVGGDQIVGFEPRFLNASDAEGARGVAHQGKLRDQIVGRIGAISLVFRVDVISERLFAGIENHRQMGGPVAVLHVLEQLPQHVAVAGDRAGGQPVGLAR